MKYSGSRHRTAVFGDVFQRLTQLHFQRYSLASFKVASKQLTQRPTGAKIASMGRPSTYTDEIADSIAERLVTRTLRRICAEDSDVPDRVTIQRWIAQNEGFATKCARARQEHARYLLEIASDAVEDCDEENYNAAKVKFGSFGWLAERLLSKEYGNKVAVTGDGGGPIGITVVSSVPRPEREGEK